MHGTSQSNTMGNDPSMPSWVRKVINGIDKWSDWVGYAVMLTLIPMVLGGAYEVIARYFFKAPTVWSTDVTFMANGTMYMLGGAYALLKGSHVRTDMFYEKYSDRTKGMVDLIAYVVFFIPVMVVIFYISINDAIRAFEIQERSNAGMWQPILWPFRAVIPLAAVLLSIQGVSEILKSAWAVKTGRLYETHEKIEI